MMRSDASDRVQRRCRYRNTVTDRHRMDMWTKQMEERPWISNLSTRCPRNQKAQPRGKLAFHHARDQPAILPFLQLLVGQAKNEAESPHMPKVSIYI